MNRKKLLAMLLALSMVFAFTSCGEEKEAEVYKWPDTELGKLLPEIKAEVTDLSSDEESLSATLKITQDQWKDYVSKCREAGFSEKEEYSEGEYCGFTARNKDSYELSLDYDDEEKSCSLYLYSAAYVKERDKELEEEDEETEEEESTSESSDSNKKKKGGSGDFRKTMDEYEDFMNDYVAFMKKYNDSDDVMSMMDDYNDMMKKYQDFSDKIDNIDTDKLSDEDLAYYTEVTQRVSKKIADM